MKPCEATLLFLPTYSPDLNPIELLFSMLKTLRRQFEARTIKALWARIGALVTEFSPTECQNYFQHCGY